MFFVDSLTRQSLGLDAGSSFICEHDQLAIDFKPPRTVRVFDGFHGKSLCKPDDAIAQIVFEIPAVTITVCT